MNEANSIRAQPGRGRRHCGSEATLRLISHGKIHRIRGIESIEASYSRYCTSTPALLYLSSIGSAVVTSDRRTFIQQAGVGLAMAGLTVAATGKAGGI